MKVNMLYFCSKREFYVEPSNYCDWFEKRKPTLIKRKCKNCIHFSNEKKQNESQKKQNKSQTTLKKEDKKTQS